MTAKKYANKNLLGKKVAPTQDLIGKVPDELNARLAALVLCLAVQQERSLAQKQECLNRLSKQDRGYALELLMGSLRCYLPLKLKVRQCFSKPLRKQDAWLESWLILGLYQLVYMGSPSHAIVHSSVELVRALGFDHLIGLTNGVLRTLHRELEPLLANKHDDELHQWLSLKPHDYLNELHWIYAIIFADWKPHFIDIMRQFQQQPPLTLRINQKQITLEAYEALLMAEQIECNRSQQVKWTPMCLKLAKSQNVELLPGYELGYFSVQDFSAQQAPMVLVEYLRRYELLQPGLKVLDACAAPGGKTAALLELLPDTAQVHAVEIDPERITRVHTNLQRLQLNGDRVKVICADLVEPHADIDKVRAQGGYDAILLDVPCSGTGVIARHPDILWCRRQRDIAVLVETQRQLLQRTEALLKPGGLLLYATCSILKAENDDNIQWYIDNLSQSLKAIPLDEHVGQPQLYGSQRLPIPGQEGDGFYYALFRKQR